MDNTSTIDVDLTAIAENLRLLRHIVGSDCMLCPIVKADAYGLGAPRIAKTLLDSGADMLAVYTPAQASELVRAAIGAPILVLMPVREVDRQDDIYRGLICGKLHLTVHDEAHLNSLIALAERFGADIPVHLEIDTGMSRGGCPMEEAPAVLRRIAQHRRLKLTGVFTHFASAEADAQMTEAQLTAFDTLLNEQAEHIPDSCLVHVANSFATLRAHRYHKAMVRIGLAWAGYGMESLDGGEIIADGQNLQPAVTWRSTIVQVRRIAAGSTVGYGTRWTAPRQSIVGLIPVGYADGYPAMAGRTDTADAGAVVGVRIGGRLAFAPVIGAVNMDQITVDLTDLCNSSQVELTPGTEVELISADPAAPNHLPRLAQAAGTFSHEMLCRLNPRLKRRYHSSTKHRASPATPQVAAAS